MAQVSEPVLVQSRGGGGWPTTKRMLGRAFSTMPRRSVLVIVLAVLHSGLQGSSVLLLLPVLGSLGIGGASGTAITDWLRNLFGVLGIPYHLAAILGFVFLVGVLTAAVGVLEMWVAHSMFRRFVGDLQIETYEAVINSRLTYLSRQRVGEMVTILTKFADQSGNALFVLVRVLMSCLMAAALIFVALLQAWAFVIAILVVVSVSVWPLRLYSQVIHRVANQAHGQFREVGAEISEHLRVLPTIKAFGAQAQSLKMVAKKMRLVQHLVIELRRRTDAVRALSDVAMLGLLCIAVYVSAEVFRLTVDRLLILVGVFMRLMPAVQNIIIRTEQLPVLLAAFDGVMELLATCRTVGEPKGGLAPPLGSLRYGVQLHNVRVVDGDSVILHDVSLTIAPHSVTALAGPSGAGKSTIAAAILGLVEVTVGSVEIDGVDLRRIDRQAWRRRTGYVSQDVPIFNGTIRDNLLLAVPDADDAAMYAALEDAGAGDFIRGLPDGLDTPVGEQGSLISGGERQRIAIARALLRKPLLLILDEPTSALDSDTVQKTMSTVERLRESTAVLFISHDLDVVRNADVIYVVDKGQIIEQGTWADLMDRGGQLFKLALLQGRA